MINHFLDPKDCFTMGIPGIVFNGGANTTTSEYYTSLQVDIGMTSAGSTMVPQAIFILAIFISWTGKHTILII